MPVAALVRVGSPSKPRYQRRQGVRCGDVIGRANPAGTVPPGLSVIGQDLHVVAKACAYRVPQVVAGLGASGEGRTRSVRTRVPSGQTNGSPCEQDVGDLGVGRPQGPRAGSGSRCVAGQVRTSVPRPPPSTRVAWPQVVQAHDAGGCRRRDGEQQRWRWGVEIGTIGRSLSCGQAVENQLSAARNHVPTQPPVPPISNTHHHRENLIVASAFRSPSLGCCVAAPPPDVFSWFAVREGL